MTCFSLCMGYTLPMVNFNILVAGLYTERWEGVNNGLARPEVGHSFVFLSLQTDLHTDLQTLCLCLSLSCHDVLWSQN